MLAWLRQVPKKHPFLFGVGFSAFKGGTVDFLIQTQAEGKSLAEWDRRRTGLFTAFNACFCGAWQYLLFVKLMPRFCVGAEAFAAKPIREKLKDSVGLRNLAIQNFMENGINNPVLYFPIFYTFKAAMNGSETPFQDAIRKYSVSYKEDIPAILAVWIPAQTINFGFSPMWFRVPFVATVSAAWTAFVSITRGASTKEELQPGSEDVAPAVPLIAAPAAMPVAAPVAAPAAAPATPPVAVPMTTSPRT